MSNNWWADKLAGNTPAPSTRSVPGPQAPVAAPRYVPPATPAAPPAKAAHTRNSDYCPECNSGNYMRQGSGNYYRCYDCGYPLVQTTSGMGSARGEGPVQKARQPTMGSGFQPTTIVGRIE